MRKILTIKSVLMGCGILGIVVVLVWLGLYTNTIKLPITRTISTSIVTDLSDDRRLVGFSSNVFVGRVIREVGTSRLTTIPYTLFEVEVIYNIKGNIQGTVVAGHEGGYKNGIFYGMGGDIGFSIAQPGITLLDQGATYLFATAYSERESFYGIVGNSRELISQDKNLTKVQLEALVKNNERAKQLQAAYPNEILLYQNIAAGYTRNSYYSIKFVPLRYTVNLWDDRRLLGASNNVFAGRVIRQAGNKSATDIPETQFEVEVIDNIKGNLEGTVIVSQEGGIKDGMLYIIRDTGEFPQGPDKPKATSLPVRQIIPGELYLFATRYDKGNNWYDLISHPNAIVYLFPGVAGLPKTQLQEFLKGTGEFFPKLRNLRAQEIPLEAGDYKKN